MRPLVGPRRGRGPPLASRRALMSARSPPLGAPGRRAQPRCGRHARRAGYSSVWATPPPRSWRGPPPAARTARRQRFLHETRAGESRAFALHWGRAWGRREGAGGWVSERARRPRARGARPRGRGTVGARGAGRPGRAGARHRAVPLGGGMAAQHVPAAGWATLCRSSSNAAAAGAARTRRRGRSQNAGGARSCACPGRAWPRGRALRGRAGRGAAPRHLRPALIAPRIASRASSSVSTRRPNPRRSTLNSPPWRSRTSAPSASMEMSSASSAGASGSRWRARSEANWSLSSCRVCVWGGGGGEAG
jgi:hypothetical protein